MSVLVVQWAWQIKLKNDQMEPAAPLIIVAGKRKWNHKSPNVLKLEKIEI